VLLVSDSGGLGREREVIECPRCKHDHEPAGNHEDDSGDMQCDECGFEFSVLVEYEPSYSSTCKVCEFGGVRTSGKGVKYRACEYCGRVKLEE